jgi:hypothetical protein
MKILLIPLDARHCNTDLPASLARVAGCEVILPPKENLGRYMRAADTDYIADFLSRNAKNADMIIVSADMCVHGGIEVSRDASVSKEEARRRLDRLERIVEKHGRKITLFSMITRGTITATRESELKLWAYTGEFNGLRAKERNAREEKRYKYLLRAIPEKVLHDYDFARARNQEINLRIAGWAAKGLLAKTLFLQDDAGAYGPHIAEQKELAEVAGKKALFMPGADEACSMLVCGAIMRALKFRAKINIVSADSAEMKRYALYERNPFAVSLSSHMEPLGLSSGKGDVDFFVNPPLENTMDLFLKKHPAKSRYYAAFVAQLKKALDAGRRVVLADCGHCNGADNYLMREIGPEYIAKLSGFAAWNTASNTLGTALAHAAMIACGTKKGRFDADESRSLALWHLLDDWIFQSDARWQCSVFCLKNKVDRFNFGRSLPKMDKLLDENMHGLSSKLMQNTPEYESYFPWGRLFEAEIKWTRN